MARVIPALAAPNWVMCYEERKRRDGGREGGAKGTMGDAIKGRE